MANVELPLVCLNLDYLSCGIAVSNQATIFIINRFITPIMPYILIWRWAVRIRAQNLALLDFLTELFWP